MADEHWDTASNSNVLNPIKNENIPGNKKQLQNIHHEPGKLYIYLKRYLLLFHDVWVWENLVFRDMIWQPW